MAWVVHELRERQGAPPQAPACRAAVDSLSAALPRKSSSPLAACYNAKKTHNPAFSETEGMTIEA